MDLALLFGRILLATVFAFAGAAKLLNRADARKAIVQFGVPTTFAGPLGSLLPAAELAIAVLLLAAPWAWWGAVGALGLLSAFTIGIAANLVMGRHPACHCFGQIRSKPIGWVTVARNAALCLCAGLIVLAGVSRSGTDVVNGLAAALDIHPLTLMVAASLTTALVAETVFLWHLFRQHGRLLVRMDQLEQRLTLPAPAVPHGLPVGAVAPSFSLATPLRTTVGLAILQQADMPVFLIFLDPNCQPCATLLPEVGQWQRLHSENLRIAVVSRDSEHANRRMAQRFDLVDVLIQKDSEVSDAYGVLGTPAAVFIRADGTIGHEAALGRDAIHNLLTFALEASIARIAAPTDSEEGQRPYGTVTR